MQNITAQQLWDVEFLKDRLQAGLERMKMAQFEQDWKRAETEALRRVSNAVEHYAECESPRCRRARRCAGNRAPCQLLSGCELKPEEMQRLVEKVYVRIQQERRAAAYGAAKPDRHRPAPVLHPDRGRRGDPVIKNADETQRAQQPVWHTGSPHGRG